MAKKKKSYNPFKMWGAWIGLIILFTVGLFLNFGILSDSFTHNAIVTSVSFGGCERVLVAVCGGVVGAANCPQGLECIDENFPPAKDGTLNCYDTICSDGTARPLIFTLGIVLLGGVFGFLVGWGVHSIFRKMRRKN